MKQKELKNLAKKIVKLELELQNCDDSFKRAQLEKEIMELSGKVTNINDMIAIDDLVQEYLAKI
jgi:hypothetical protein